MKHLICWVFGHRWFEVSYTRDAPTPHSRTKECTRCGSTQVWVKGERP